MKMESAKTEKKLLHVMKKALSEAENLFEQRFLTSR